MKSRTTENEIWICSPWQPKMKSLATENVYHRKLNKILSPPMSNDIWDTGKSDAKPDKAFSLDYSSHTDKHSLLDCDGVLNEFLSLLLEHLECFNVFSPSVQAHAVSTLPCETRRQGWVPARGTVPAAGQGSGHHPFQGQTSRSSTGLSHEEPNSCLGETWNRRKQTASTVFYTW